jgi:hypothetical protein
MRFKLSITWCLFAPSGIKNPVFVKDITADKMGSDTFILLSEINFIE